MKAEKKFNKMVIRIFNKLHLTSFVIAMLFLFGSQLYYANFKMKISGFDEEISQIEKSIDDNKVYKLKEEKKAKELDSEIKEIFKNKSKKVAEISTTNKRKKLEELRKSIEEYVSLERKFLSQKNSLEQKDFENKVEIIFFTLLRCVLGVFALIVIYFISSWMLSVHEILDKIQKSNNG